MTVEFVLPDQAERDAIRERVDINMCVEAGAGTGKTSVLVDRIVNVLATGHADVQHLAVITFTEKAAAELAGRVRKGLEDALEAADDERRARLERALRDLNHAHIETIHAFAASLLRERPVEAGLDPGFDVLDDLPAQLAFEAAYGDWLTAEMAADPPPAALVDALNLGLPFPLVREAAESLHRSREMLPLRDYAAVDVNAAAVVARFGELAQELRALEPYCNVPGDRGLAQLRRLADACDDLAKLRGHDAALRRTIAQMQKVRPNDGNQDNWRTKDDCRRLKELFRAIADVVDRARDDMREGATARLLAWLQGFVLAYEHRRREESKADFDDLLIWARDLLRGNEEVRRYFQGKYRCVLVDEFQDTDPLQVEIIVYLCAEHVDGDWRRARLREGSLFVVGDPKQSIYRFRGADIAMYDEVKRHVFGGAPVRIVQNFRSARPVIAWVNRVFAGLMREDEGVQPPYVGLEPHPAFAADDAVTVLRGAAPVSENRYGQAKEMRRFEAEKLAMLVRRSVDGRAWPVRGDGEPRPATYRDVVVVIPNRTDLDVYEDAFARAGVPYRHEGGRTFFQRQEVRELVAVLRAIDDPSDGVAAVAALRSSAFGCSDEDLLLHSAAGRSFDYMRLPVDAAGPVAESMRALRDLAVLRHERPLPELVRAVLDRTRLVEFAMLQPQGEQVAANLLKVIDQARTFAEASGRGLRGFVRWLKENIARVSDETDAPISEETDDVVRILTVHASKGLEFPVVVFANMNTARYDRTKVIRDRPARRLHVKLGNRDAGFRTPGYDGAETHEKDHVLAEELRLLYVAATRAKDRLVVPFFATSDSDAPPSEPRCLNDWLRVAGAHRDPAVDLAALGAPAGELPIWRRPPADAPPAAVARVQTARAAWLAEHDALVARAAVPLTIRTASALKPEWAAPPAAGDGVRRGRTADFGSAVHALLERIELRAAADIDAAVRAVAAEYGQRGREAEIARVARRVLDSDAVARALRSPRMLQEAPFTVALPQEEARRHGLAEGLAEGRIDLLFEEDGALVIVDFKTDAVTAAEVAERAEFYRNQALVYTWAAHTATRMPVREVIFLFARPGIEQAMPVDAAFLAEAEALMRAAPAATEA